MRNKKSLDKGWMYHIGEAGPVAKTGQKSGALGGLTNCLGEEPFEPFAGAKKAVAHLKRIFPVGEGIEISEQDLLRIFCNCDASLDGWKKTDLPHDFRLELGYEDLPSLTAQGYLKNGICYYRKTFPVPKEDEGRRIVLEFDVVMRDACCWYNGCFLGNHVSGYTGFEFDVTELTKYGEGEGINVLLVRCDTTQGDEGWWYEGGGIYRHVWLTKYAPLHVDRWGTYIKPKINGNNAEVAVEVTVRNQSSEETAFEVKTEFLDADGNCHGTAEGSGHAKMEETVTVFCNGKAENIQLWDLEHPILYIARTTILVNGEVTDEYCTSFGFRTVEYTLEGLKLNGKAVPLYGACVHQDFAGIGTALPDAVQDYKVKRMKDMGLNAYRSSHHNAAIELLDACDRQGMLVLDENRLIETTEHCMYDLTEMLKRGRNHPCIFGWSLSNEELFSGSCQAKRILRKLLPFARQLDNTRLYVAAEAFTTAEEAGEYGCEIYDAYGINYGESYMSAGKYDALREMYPQMKLLNTENASWFSTRGIYKDDAERGYCSCYGSRFAMMGGEGGPNAGGTARPAQMWQFYNENPITGGFFIWTGFDYRGEPSPKREFLVSSNFGVMDICGFAKDDYYYYQSVLKKEPMIHIMPHWTWETEGEQKEIRLYTNCSEAELFLNGKSLGRKELTGSWITYETAYEPGELLAVGYLGTEKAAEDRKQTAGKAAVLCLSANRDSLHSDGSDVGFVTISVCDKDGIEVPDASSFITVEVSGAGALLGIGNGDPNCREDDKCGKRHAFSGRLMALVQSNGQKGDIHLTAKSDGLKEGRLILTAGE